MSLPSPRTPVSPSNDFSHRQLLTLLHDTPPLILLLPLSLPVLPPIYSSITLALVIYTLAIRYILSHPQLHAPPLIAFIIPFTAYLQQTRITYAIHLLYLLTAVRPFKILSAEITSFQAIIVTDVLCSFSWFLKDFATSLELDVIWPYTSGLCMWYRSSSLLTCHPYIILAAFRLY